MYNTLIFAIALIIIAAGFPAASANAEIRCKGSYQIIPGVGFHSSPYCEIKHLAKVARRAYGISTSFKRLRDSVGEREDVCRAIGHDHRVYSICHEYRPDSSSRHWN